MIELRVDLTDDASIAKAAAVLTALANAGVPATQVVVTTDKPASKPRAKPAEKPVEKAPPKEEPKPEPLAEGDLLGDEPDEAPQVPAATRDDAAKAIVELSKKKGRAAAVAVLEKFRPEGMPTTVKNADGEVVPNEVKLPLIAKENYGKLVAEAKKALAAE